MALGAIVCPACNVEEVFDRDTGPPPIHDVGEFSCDACGARFVFGEPAPRVFVERYIDAARGLCWASVRIRYGEQDMTFRLDPKLAVVLARELLATVVRP
jgi:hypothetical protein